MTLLFTLCALLPAATILVPTAPLFAGERDSYGFGGFFLGTQWMEISDINSELSAKGYASFKEPVYSWGFESYYALNGRFLLGGEFQFFCDESTNAAYVQKLSSYWGFFNFGYAVISKSARGFHLYPIAGLGASRMGLRLTARDTLDFNDVLSDPKRESNLNKWDFLAQAALGLDYTFGSKRNEDKGGGGFMLGVRAGSQYSFTVSKWNMSDLDVSGDPGAGMSGFFVRVVLGGSGYGYSHDSDEWDG